MVVSRTSTEDVSQYVVLTEETNKPADSTSEEMFHTTIVDDQDVTKNHGVEATTKDEGSIPNFDEILDIDTLYEGGLVYPFDNETTGNKEGQTHPTDDATRDEDHTFDDSKEIEMPKTSTVADSTSPTIEKKDNVPKASADVESNPTPSLIK